MRYQRFEDLPVWNAAIELAVQVHELTSKSQFTSRYGLKDQIERAAVSVSNNIAEGFERLTPNELRNFLVIARGSAGEIRSMVGVVVRRREMQPHVSQLQGIRTTAESCARQLGAWIKTIDNPKQSRKPARPRNSHDRTID